MVAYSFNKRFAGPIQQGIKTQTIRAPRKRHARVGEAVQLYCGMRTSRCFPIVSDVICTEVLHAELSFTTDRVILHTGRDEIGAMSGLFAITTYASLNEFARRDGFISWADMKAFWRETHEEAADPDLYFDGVLINWGAPYLAQVAS
ncbi:MAG: hypothetical protein ACRDBL_09175 [Rhabdaerophilum sp.]